MQYLVEQMRRLKTNSDEIEEKLYQLLSEVLALLQKNFQDKSGLLKNDFADLQRQEKEIEYTEAFMLRQAHDCDPVSFLQIWDSYRNHIKQLAK